MNLSRLLSPNQLSLSIRLGLSLGVLLLYALIFSWMYPNIQVTIAPLVMLPIITIQWFFGMKQTTIINIFILLGNNIFIIWLREFSYWEGFERFFPGSIVGVFIIFTVGWLRDLFFKVKEQAEALNNEIIKREEAEAVLTNYQDDLKGLIDNRTQALMLTNQQLEQEVNNHKQTSQALQIAKDKAEATNQAKSRFLANMSHELRTPLNIILSYTQILNQDESLTDKQHHAIKTMQQSGEHLLTLLNDILDISKIEADKMVVEPTEIHLAHFIKNIAEVFQVRAQQKGLWFKYNISPKLPMVVKADAKRLRQILINLLGNAIKFTEEGGVKFTIDYQQNHTRFQIEDTGIGMTPEQLTTIFHPFEQVGSHYNKTEGTGLGLAISQRLTEVMGGILHVESTPGKGSIFVLDLTLSPVEGWIEKPENNTADIIGVEGGIYKVLIVDDIAENRMVLRKIMTLSGFEICEAVDGEDAINQAKTFQPDLILMDIRMPVMNGLEATQHIRTIKNLEKTVIIAVSASAFVDDQQVSLAAGCDDFLVKPIRIKTLLQKIQKLLNITWRYKTPVKTANNTEQAAHSLPLIGPSPAQASLLFELAQNGGIKGLKQELSALKEQNEQFVPFVAQVNQYLDVYQFEEICALLETYLENDPHEQ